MSKVTWILPLNVRVSDLHRKLCHRPFVVYRILLMLLLYFDWLKRLLGGIGRCHIWPLRKVLFCTL